MEGQDIGSPHKLCCAYCGVEFKEGEVTVKHGVKTPAVLHTACVPLFMKRASAPQDHKEAVRRHVHMELLMSRLEELADGRVIGDVSAVVYRLAVEFGLYAPGSIVLAPEWLVHLVSGYSLSLDQAEALAAAGKKRTEDRVPAAPALPATEKYRRRFDGR
jgi:hypothetical protein